MILDMLCYSSALQTSLSKIMKITWKTQVSFTNYAKHSNSINQQKPVKLGGNISTLLSCLQTEPGLNCNWLIEQRLGLDYWIQWESQEPKISSDVVILV